MLIYRKTLRGQIRESERGGNGDAGLREVHSNNRL